MLSATQRQRIYAAIVALFVIAMLMEVNLGPKHEEYMPRQTNDTIAKTPFEALVPALLGIREIIASLLWVKTDDYFHEGQYKPILQLVKLITTIDPHQLDVYATGAWHMAYNFMDKRLIDAGLEFLTEGVKNNPTVYDLFFELGYTHFDKTKNFPEAIRWDKEALTKVTSDGKPAPAFVGFQIAHAEEHAGLIDEAVKQWEWNRERTEKYLKEHPKDFAAMQNFGVASNNLKMTRWRINDRRDRASDPADTNLQYTVTRLGPRKLQVEGTINALDYSRVRVMIHDKDWDKMLAHSIDYRMANATLEWDDVQVRQGHFKKILDLNKDPGDMGRSAEEVYPMKSDEFELSVTFNPRLQAVFIQDRYGWSGEGLTDKQYLKIDPNRTGIVEGKPHPLRYVEKTTILKRTDIV